jgi:hypothetical protein
MALSRRKAGREEEMGAKVPARRHSVYARLPSAIDASRSFEEDRHANIVTNANVEVRRGI